LYLFIPIYLETYKTIQKSNRIIYRGEWAQGHKGTRAQWRNGGLPHVHPAPI